MYRCRRDAQDRRVCRRVSRDNYIARATIRTDTERVRGRIKRDKLLDLRGFVTNLSASISRHRDRNEGLAIVIYVQLYFCISFYRLSFLSNERTFVYILQRSVI